MSITVAVGAGSLIGACSQGGDPPVSPQGADPVVTSEKTPPAISGGTLIVSHSRPNLAVASDSDRDKVWMVDLTAGLPVGEVDLEENDEPGRLVEDSHGRVHVILRKGGALASIDLATNKVERRQVCAAPRGIAYDQARDVVHVACMNGELVTFKATGGNATRRLRLERDLRDVIVQGDDLLVSKFRSAELLTVDADGNILGRTAPPTVKSSRMRQRNHQEQFSPDQAWRTIGLPDGSVAMLHQRALDTQVVIREGGGDSYGGGGDTPGCDPTIVHTAITVFDKNHLSQSPVNGTPALPNTLLSVDMASHVDARGNLEFAFVAAADNRVVKISPHTLEAATGPDTNCSDGDGGTPVAGEPVALAYWGDEIVVQTRDPIAISIIGNAKQPIVLPGIDTKDTGHDLFHRNDGGTVKLVCANCHGENRDDGHVWNFNTGPRRTQNIANDVMTTAPFHWDGAMKDLGMIMHEVFEKRMGGRPQGKAHIDAFESWVSKIPAMPNPISGDADQIARGEELFRNKGNCVSCHSGEKFTNNQNKDVGTGRTFQVPSLIGVALRAPYMHDGCALTLKDRFDPACGGKDHGNTKDMTNAEIDDLVAYLESL